MGVTRRVEEGAVPSDLPGTAMPDVVERATTRPPLRRRRADLTPYLLLLPATLFLLTFFVWPMLQALVLAVQTSASALTLDNFQKMVHDLNFVDALRNTILLLLVIVPLQVVLALIMALLINAGLRFAGFFLYVWTIPLAISDLAAGIAWLAIFTERGYINSFLHQLGLAPIPFLSYEHPAGIFTAVVVAEVWRATSVVMVILVAGLQMIPKDYGEAAAVFGATGWQRLRYVTLPLLRPSLQVALILRTILAFQVFAVVVALAGNTLPVLAGEAYNWYGNYRDVGVAAAYATVILALSILNTFIYLRVLGTRREEMA